MSIALWQELKALRARIEQLEGRSQPVFEQEQKPELEARVTKLENNYRMMNARLARGKNDG